MNRRTDALPLPEFYRPEHAAEWAYAPDQQALFEHAVRWRRTHDLQPASADAPRVHLLLIDLQKDFCLPEGALYVGGRSGRGAVDDSDRTARFIYRNLRAITEITCTMDTHAPFQIFSPSFWVAADGAAPAAHREVTVADVREGRLRPNPALAGWLAGGDYDALRRHTEFYCAELERAGRYTLYLWPPHCILGSEGHALAGVIHEARMFHAFARLAPNRIELKGRHPLTENYSVLAPEVLARADGAPVAERNTEFLHTLSAADAIVVAGQAASHCVRSSVEDLIEQIEPGRASNVYLLRDCMSSVAVPDAQQPGEYVADFTPAADAALQRFVDAGVHLVDSTRPISEWPGLEALTRT